MKKYFKWIAIVVSAIILLLVVRLGNNLVETNKAGYYQVKQQFLKGTLTVRNTPGTYWQGLGMIETYEISGDIFLSKEAEDSPDGKNNDTNIAERVLFPNGYADINFVGMYEVAPMVESQTMLHIKYNTDENVKYMVKQQIIEALKNTGTLMSAEEAYSNKRAEFISLAREQALKGLYKAHVETDTISVSGGQKSIIKKYSVEYDASGNPVIMKESLLAKYNITLPQFNVKDMDFDPKLVALIEARKDAQKAEQDAITEKAKGEAKIAAEKATQEIDKIKQVTIAQKEKEVAELNASKGYEVAKFQAMEAKEKAKKIEAEGMANAAANRALVAAGLTPEQQMQMDIKIAEVVSANIAKAPTPQIVFLNGGGSGGTGAEEAMKVFGAERALELMKKMGTVTGGK